MKEVIKFDNINKEYFQIVIPKGIINCKVNVFLPLFIPPAYEVYRGYIVFAFSVTMFVCLLTFFSVRDFSETT